MGHRPFSGAYGTEATKYDHSVTFHFLSWDSYGIISFIIVPREVPRRKPNHLCDGSSQLSTCPHLEWTSRNGGHTCERFSAWFGVGESTSGPDFGGRKVHLWFRSNSEWPWLIQPLQWQLESTDREVTEDSRQWKDLPGPWICRIKFGNGCNNTKINLQM